MIYGGTHADLHSSFYFFFFRFLPCAWMRPLEVLRGCGVDPLSRSVSGFSPLTACVFSLHTFSADRPVIRYRAARG